jgi:POT family proton-dependent oligopeptide transporter
MTQPRPADEPASVDAKPAAHEARAAEPGKGRLPPQVGFIIGNEACERFSFYGMRNILTMFLTSYLLLELGGEQVRKDAAKEVFHLFVMGVYFFPLLGGWISDTFWGKYRTIFWISLLYCAGHACLALFESYKPGFYLGLFLIALGSGGIKPCVSSFVGDQFDQSNKHLARVVFDAFYWIINFGSFFASLLIPLVLKSWGPAWAFGIPGILMGIATLVLWIGRHRYVNVPPAPSDPHSFLRVARTALLARGDDGDRPGLTIAAIGAALALASLGTIYWLGVIPGVCLAMVLFLLPFCLGVRRQLDRARGEHPDEAVEGVSAVLRLLVVFGLVTPFWSLFDQKASTWIHQAEAMALPGWSWLKSASQMQALNPLLVMLLIPFNNVVLYPLLRRSGIEPTPLRRMTVGMAFAGLSWIAVAVMQLSLDAGQPMTILWQVLPYALLTFGEVLVSATGLEFAYSQAPVKMKGVLMSFWSLGVTVGNLWVLVVNALVKGEGATRAISSTGIGVTAFQMFFFAVFAFAAAAAFGLYARRYRVADFYRPAT